MESTFGIVFPLRSGRLWEGAPEGMEVGNAGNDDEAGKLL